MMALPFSGHGVTLGGLRLVDWGQPVTHDEGYTFEISADGTTWGNPQVVVSSLISMLSSGEIVEQQRTGNREPVLYVRISATDHHALVAGDSALGAVVGGPCELVWQPPDSDAPPTVIDVVHSRMDHQWDDMDALKFQRVWVITMSALPWPRSADLVVTPAVATSTTTTVDDGSSTTNWAVLGPGALSASGGAVVSTYDPRIVAVYGSAGTALQRNAAIDTSVEKYIAVTWKSSISGYYAFRQPGGPNMAELRREPAASGYTRSWFRVSDATATVSAIYLDVLHPVSALTSATLSIDKVETAETLPITGTSRQLTRTVDPDGNVPAEGTIIVGHPTQGLGQTIIYTHPAGGGYSPPLRQWRYSSDVVAADTTVVSGATNTLVGATDYRVPVAAIPEGDVHLWARLFCNTAGSFLIFHSADSWMNGIQVGKGQGGPTRVTWTTANTWITVPLARYSLPDSPVGPAGFHRISIQRDATATASVFVDEAWLFAMDRGRLTVVDCGSGTPEVGSVANRLRVDAASLERPFGAISVATADDWSDSYAPRHDMVLCDQTGHRFNPNGSVVFTVTSGATGADVAFEHHPRWRAEAS